MSYQLSIITVTFNAAQSVEKTIRSVINQTVFDDQIEYIVIDGGSTDGTLDILERYRDKFAHLVSEPDHGIYDAMNKGARLATAPWILFMNADDTIFDNETVESLHLEDRQPDHIVYGDHITTHGTGTELPCRAHPFWQYPELIAGLGICHQSIYMPTVWMIEHPFEWKKYNYCADFEAVHYWWQRECRMVYEPRPLCRFEQGEGYSSRPEVWLKLLDQNARIAGRRYTLTYYKIWLRRKLGFC